MNSKLEQREAQTKQKIGFEKLLSSIDAKRGVAVHWPELRTFLPAGEQGWVISSDEVNFSESAGLVERTILFEKGAAQFEMNLFVSSRGPEPALRRLLDTMLATSLWPDPYTPGPSGIGQLCLLLPVASPSVLVINHNVYFALRVDGYSLDLIAIARSMTKFMDEHLVPVVTSQTPKFGNFKIIPEHPLAGTPFRVDLALPQASNPKQLLWMLSREVDYDLVDQREIGAQHIILKVNRPGTVEIPFWLADRSTLLSSEVRISVDIQPEKKK